jgi:UDP-N-acetylglucosamine 2-epimerase (non-hydrolysing)
MADRLRREPGVRVHASVPRPDFAVLLANAAAIVGNSSSGLTEAPLLKVPAVNIGERQAGRLQGDNVIDSAPSRSAIEAALERALDPAFRRGLQGVSPHGGEQSAATAIVDTLADEPIDERLSIKRGR